MVEDRGIGAAGIFESVSQDGESVRVESATGQDALVVSSLRQAYDGEGSLRRVEGDRTEGISHNLS